ncbi:MAG: tyrosine-type recombinase/integrase [Micromonosporaceae bacterium]|nr:tyrosine-type recombinase/integrase [Micromonosporaceae bacterium]
MRDPAVLAPPPSTGIAAAVAALPALPATDPTDRYGVRRLTVTWLAGFAPHTRTAYFRDLAHFLAWCQRDGLDPCRARPADLGQYRAAVEQPAPGHPPPSPATVHRRLSALSSWYRHLITNRAAELDGNPLAGLRRPRVDRDASRTAGLTATEVRALLASAEVTAAARATAADGRPSPHRQARQLAGLRDRALVRLLADLGLRVGEALRLDLDALTYNRGRHTLRYLGKGGAQRERPLPAGTRAALDDYLAVRAQAVGVSVGELAGPLFATTSPAGGAGRLSEPAAFRLVRRLARQAQLPSAGRLSPHSLRHAFATNARELGVPLEDVQDAMGHADARTTRRYDRGRHALHRDPALRLGELYAEPG